VRILSRLLTIVGVAFAPAAIAMPLPFGKCTGIVGGGTATIVIDGVRADGLPTGTASYESPRASLVPTPFGANFNVNDHMKVDLFRPNGSLWYSGISIQNGIMRGNYNPPLGTSLSINLTCNAANK
jgi:hypothetical protein